MLQEFFVNATQKLKPGLDRRTAREEVRDLRAWRPLTLTLDTVEAAWGVQDRFGLSFWDALIVASALAGGCRYLLTEDLQHGQELDGLQVVSPFRVRPGEI